MTKKEKLEQKIKNNNVKILDFNEKIKTLQKDIIQAQKELSELKEKEILNLIKRKNLDFEDLYKMLDDETLDN